MQASRQLIKALQSSLRKSRSAPLRLSRSGIFIFPVSTQLSSAALHHLIEQGGVFAAKVPRIQELCRFRAQLLQYRLPGLPRARGGAAKERAR